MNRLVHTALRTRLAADVSVAAIVGGRIYAVLAAPEAEYPFIVLSLDGGPVNDTGGDDWTVTATVLAVALSGATAADAAEAVRAALHEREWPMTGGYAVFDCRLTAAVEYAEVEERSIYYYAGGKYRLRICEG